MKSTIRYFWFLFIITNSFGGFAYGQNKVAKEDLPNFSQVSTHLYRGGQPTEAGLKKLREDFKVKTIIYLRDADKRAETEETWAQNMGIKFVNIPLNNWFKPKDADMKEILSLINTPENQPVFVHCKRGSDRTGVVVAVYRITHDGWTAEQAADEAKRFHFGWWQFWMKDYIKDYYKDFKKKT